jgi:hypothetical protein
MARKLKKELPEGSKLIAELWDEPEYPGIRISLKKPDGMVEIVCFAEYNSAKPPEKRLCVAAYSSAHDEPVYYECYNDPQAPSPNV